MHSTIELTKETYLNPRPLRRYFARLFDYSLFGFIFCVWFFAYSEHLEPLLGILLIFIWVFVEAGLLSTWGTTPGKFLLGIILRDSAGEKLTFSKALNRSFSVWWRGMGIGFPIVTLFTLISSHRRLIREGITHWDHEGKFCISYKKLSGLRIVETVLSFSVFAFLIVLSTFTENRYQQYDWKRFSSSEGAFSVLLPGTPTEEKDILNTPVGRVDMHTFMLEHEDGILYSVAYSDYPDMYIQKSTSDVILDGARDGAVANLHGTLLRDLIVSLNGYSGRDFKIEAAGGSIVLARVYLVKSRLYLTTVTTSKERVFSPGIGKFLDSFKLMAM